jgi:beta-N-acetylhexosaminidase
MIAVAAVRVLGVEGSSYRPPTASGWRIRWSARHPVRAQLREPDQLVRADRRDPPRGAACRSPSTTRRARAALRAGFTAIRDGARSASRGIATCRAQRGRGARRDDRRARAHGVDFSFAPVLDLDWGSSTVIGDRAFTATRTSVAHWRPVAWALRSRAMAPSASTFPGTATSRPIAHEVPSTSADGRDPRPRPRAVRGAAQGGLEGISRAHVVYRRSRRQPAGYRACGCRRSCAGASASTASFLDDLAWPARTARRT